MEGSTASLNGEEMGGQGEQQAGGDGTENVATGATFACGERSARIYTLTSMAMSTVQPKNSGPINAGVTIMGIQPRGRKQGMRRRGGKQLRYCWRK
jgi:hypothetical protein